MITTEQLRALHAIGRKRGLTHEDLRAAAGVASLKELSRAAAGRLIDRLNADQPSGGGPASDRSTHGGPDSDRSTHGGPVSDRSVYQPRHRSRRKPLRPGELRHAGDATSRQRELVADLLERLGWSAQSRAHWLWSRHRIRDMAKDRIPRDRASAIITQLEAALAKSDPSRDREGAGQGGDPARAHAQEPQP